MEKYFSHFNNIFHGIIAGPLLAFIFLFLKLDTGSINPVFDGPDYTYVSAACFLVSLGYFFWLIFRFKIERRELIGKNDLKVRLDDYRRVSTKFYILMTLTGVLAIVVTFLTGELTFGFIYMVQLFLLSVYRPSVHNICKYLDLKGEEREFVLKKKEWV